MFGGLFNQKKTQQDDDWGKPLASTQDQSQQDETTDQTEEPAQKSEEHTNDNRNVEENTSEPASTIEGKEEQTSEDTQDDPTTSQEVTDSESADDNQEEKTEENLEERSEETKSTEDISRETTQDTETPTEKQEDTNRATYDPFSNNPDIQPPVFPPDTSEQASMTQNKRIHFLDDFGIDITKKAEENKFHTIIERDLEMDKMVHILLKSKNNCPLIIGESGVGKSSLVYGLAQRIVAGTVPNELQDAYIIQIDCIELESLLDKKEIVLNLESLLQKIEQLKQKTVILLDGLSRAPESIHAILSTLKTYLAKEEIQVIICATPLEYQRYFSDDSLFQDLFEIVQISELSQETSIKIITSLIGQYEAFHKVTFDDDTIPRAVSLSKRYIGEAFLPEKAIDIIDDAATLVKLAMTKHVKTGNHVTRKDIEKVISERTGISLTTLIQDETEVLLKLEEYIHQSYVDQEQAVKKVADVIRKGRSVLSTAKHPVGALLLVGPTGSGKAQLAKVLATTLFGTEKALIQLDITQENYEAKLMDAVYAKPYSLVFLKDFETSHQQTFHLLAEVFDSGQATDHKGNTVSFENTIIVCSLTTGAEQSEENTPVTEQNVYNTLQKTLKSEVINKFDEVIVFEPLSQKSLKDIVSLKIQTLNERLMRQNIFLAVSDNVLEKLATEAYNPLYGGHLLEKIIESSIENPVATLLLGKSFVPGDTITVTLDTSTDTFVFAKTLRNIAEQHTIQDTEVLSEKQSLSQNVPDQNTPRETYGEPKQENIEDEPVQDKKITTGQVNTTVESNQEIEKKDNKPHPLSFGTYHQQVKHAYSDLLANIKKD